MAHTRTHIYTHTHLHAHAHTTHAHAYRPVIYIHTCIYYMADAITVMDLKGPQMVLCGNIETSTFSPSSFDASIYRLRIVTHLLDEANVRSCGGVRKKTCRMH